MSGWCPCFLGWHFVVTSCEDVVPAELVHKVYYKTWNIRLDYYSSDDASDKRIIYHIIAHLYVQYCDIPNVPYRVRLHIQCFCFVPFMHIAPNWSSLQNTNYITSGTRRQWRISSSRGHRLMHILWMVYQINQAVQENSHSKSYSIMLITEHSFHVYTSRWSADRICI